MSRKNIGRVTPSRARTADRRRQALNLRKAGASFREIADTLGVSVGQAYADTQSAMLEVTREVAEEVLALELARLDQMQMSLWPAVRQGDVQSVNAVRAIIELRARLFGVLRAPGVTVNTTVAPQVPGAVLVIGGSKSEYIAGLRQARGELPTPPAQNGNGHTTLSEWIEHEE